MDQNEKLILSYAKKHPLLSYAALLKAHERADPSENSVDKELIKRSHLAAKREKMRPLTFEEKKKVVEEVLAKYSESFPRVCGPILLEQIKKKKT